MAHATLRWTEKAPPMKVASRPDLEAKLRDLASQSALPVLALLATPDGSSGYIGVSEFFLLGEHWLRAPW
jgi:hypothetical protein